MTPMRLRAWFWGRIEPYSYRCPTGYTQGKKDYLDSCAELGPIGCRKDLVWDLTRLGLTVRPMGSLNQISIRIRYDA